MKVEFERMCSEDGRRDPEPRNADSPQKLRKGKKTDSSLKGPGATQPC